MVVVVDVAEAAVAAAVEDAVVREGPVRAAVVVVLPGEYSSTRESALSNLASAWTNNNHRGGSGAAGSGSTRGSSRGSPRSGSYAGGARPFPPGQATGSGLRPSFVPATALAVFPGVLLLGAYVYAYDQHHHWVDQETHRNRSLPVECFCQQYMDCSCDDKSKDYAKGFDNGRPVNSSTVQDLTINGTEKIYVNGTVPNDTSSHGTSGASTLAPGQSMALNSGYWAMVAVVIGAVWM